MYGIHIFCEVFKFLRWLSPTLVVEFYVKPFLPKTREAENSLPVLNRPWQDSTARVKQGQFKTVNKLQLLAFWAKLFSRKTPKPKVGDDRLSEIGFGLQPKFDVDFQVPTIILIITTLVDMYYYSISAYK